MRNFSISGEPRKFSGLPSAFLFLKWLMRFLLFFLSLMVFYILILWLLLKEILSQSKHNSPIISSQVLQIINLIIRYMIPLNYLKKPLLTSILKAKNYKKENRWTNFPFTTVLPYFRIVGQDTLLFSHNERSVLSYPDQFSRACTRNWIIYELPPDESRSTNGDELVEFELWWKTVKDDGQNVHSWINISLTGSVHIQATKCRLAEDFVRSKQYGFREVCCVPHDSASKGKVV